MSGQPCYGLGVSAPIIFALTRHGDYCQPQDVPSAWLLHPLTEKGQAQASALGPRLHEDARARGWQVDPCWHSSVLLRAHQTATLAAKAWPEPEFKVQIQNSLSLAERSVGAAANLSVQQIEEILERDPRFDRPEPGWKSVPSFRLPVPGAESLLEAGLRVAQHIRQSARDIARQTGPSERPILKVVVGHGASLRWAAHALGVLTMEQAKACSMYHATSVYIERRGEHDWRHVGGEWKPRSRPAQD